MPVRPRCSPCRRRSGASAFSESSMKKHHPGDAGWCPLERAASGLLGLALGGRCGRFLEVVVVRHAAIHLVIEVPADRAFGEYLLRGDDLVEDRVVLPLLVDRVDDVELLAQ